MHENILILARILLTTKVFLKRRIFDCFESDCISYALSPIYFVRAKD